MLFPLGLLATYAGVRKRTGVATALTASSLCISLILGLDKMTGFLIWMAGFVVMCVWSRIRISKSGSQVAYLLLSSAVLIACLAAARSGRLTPRSADLAVGLAFGMFLFGVLQAEIRVTDKGAYLRGARMFAGFSYTLYVLHFPFLLFLRAWLVPGQRWRPDGVHLLCAAGIGVITLAFSWLLALFTEHKTADVRRLVLRLLNVSQQKIRS